MIVVNDNYRLAPWADVLYACDAEWWDHHKGVRSFAGERWTQSRRAAQQYGLHWVESKAARGLSRYGPEIHQGGNSGYQALNLAAQWGADPIVLLGYDMQTQGDKRHWFGDHPGALNKSSGYPVWVRAYNDAAADLSAWGVRAYNCTRETALTCFPRKSLSEVL